ncbi:MAG TPA: hypothetical protein VF604_20185 [Pyrinomonadaceae bacterium]|jgi:hypothetical protein
MDDRISALDFKAIIESNLTQARTYCSNFNQSQRRRTDAKYLERVKKGYLLSLGFFNLCGLCDNPIKVKQKKVVKVNREIPYHPKLFTGTPQDWVKLVTKYLGKITSNPKTNTVIETYADIPAHTETYTTKTPRKNNPKYFNLKMMYRHVDTQRIFNPVKCDCLNGNRLEYEFAKERNAFLEEIEKESKGKGKKRLDMWSRITFTAFETNRRKH